MKDWTVQDNEYDAWTLANKLGIPVQDAAEKMQREGWEFAGYDPECGTELWREPEYKEKKDLFLIVSTVLLFVVLVVIFMALVLEFVL